MDPPALRRKPLRIKLDPFKVTRSGSAVLRFVSGGCSDKSSIYGEAHMNQSARETEMLAAKLAAVRGVSPAEAVTLALEEALAKPAQGAPVRSVSERHEFVRRLEEISRRAGALPVLDPRSADEILGYDECGVPS